MAQRSQRLWTDGNAAELLAHLQTWRRHCNLVQSQIPIRGDVYLGLDALRSAIDDMVGVLTGDREHFWTKQHSIGEGPPRPGERERD